MRPIKFRAWLEDKQEMYYQYDNTASAMNGLSRFAEVVGSQVGYTPEVMQFTGLLDKNGKEIYEGDIIEWKQFQAWNKNKVYYLASGFYVDTTAFKDDLNSPTSISLASTLGCEIIGNIYENQDLIK